MIEDGGGGLGLLVEDPVGAGDGGGQGGGLPHVVQQQAQLFQLLLVTEWGDGRGVGQDEERD